MLLFNTIRDVFMVGGVERRIAPGGSSLGVALFYIANALLINNYDLLRFKIKNTLSSVIIFFMVAGGKTLAPGR